MFNYLAPDELYYLFPQFSPSPTGNNAYATALGNYMTFLSLMGYC